VKTQPIIGITTYGRDKSEHFMLPTAYVDAVRRAGGIPILLPPGEPHQAQLFELLDGLILAGGGDIDPNLYGGTLHETIYMIDEERDKGEIELVKMSLETGLPLLPICRGIQVLNVALGGTLIEHLPDEVGVEISHRQVWDSPNPPHSGPLPHPIAVESTSHLAEIMGQAEVSAASWHHQALRRVAPGLQVVAHAPDGTIEAVEMPDHPWLVAVQWHPEITAAADPVQQRLFDALVRAARKVE
jgi:putative glutamine amidotransferase